MGPNGNASGSTEQATRVDSRVPEPADSIVSLPRFSRIRFLVILIGGIALAEVVSMAVVYFFRDWSYYLQILLDASIMVVLIFPVIYLFSLRPLLLNVEQRKQNEGQLRRYNRALRVLNECNQVLVRAEDEPHLLDKMCKILVDVGGYRMAWVGFAEQDKEKRIHPVSWAGFENGYLSRAQITWADTDRGRGPTGTVVRMGVTQVNQDFLNNPKMAPWRAAALERGYQSSIALPLKDGGSVFGALTIYSEFPDAFNLEEVNLLEELANDLAYGIQALRERIERVHAEQEAEARAREWRNTFDAMSEFVSVHDKNFRIMRANKALANRFGKTPDELVGMHCYQLFHYSNEPWPNCPLVRAMKSKSAVTEEVDDPHIGCPLLISVSPVIGNNGEVVGGIHIATDITERKRAERDVELERNKLKSILDTMQEGVYIVNQNHDLEYINPAVEKEFGKIEGRKCHQFFHDFPDVCEACPTGTVLEGDVVKAERASMRTGRIYDLLHMPLRNLDGSISKLTIMHDITELKQAELALKEANESLELRVEERTQALRESEERFSKAFHSSPVGVNLFRIADGCSMDVNDAFLALTGYTRDEIIGHNAAELNLIIDSEARMAWVQGLRDHGAVRNLDFRIRQKSGQIVNALFSIVKIDINGEETGLVLAIDITERKRAEEALKRSREELELRVQERTKELERRNLDLQVVSNAEHVQRQFAEALIEAAFSLNKNLRLHDVLPLILKQVKDVIPYQLADIALLEGESFYAASHQGTSSWPESLVGANARFALDEFPLLKNMCQSGKSVLIEDTQKEPGWVKMAGLESHRSFLSAPLLAEGKVIGFVNLLADQPGFFTEQMRNHLSAFASHAAVAIQNAWLFEQVQAGTERLQSLSRRLVEIQESERLFISRELHDQAGQILTSLLVDLQLLEKNISKPRTIRKLTAEMESSLNEVIEELHRIAMALRPASLDHLGLVAALRQYVESIGEKNNIKVGFESERVLERLPGNVEAVLYRIVQEALTNVVRHASATRVDVVLTTRNKKLVMIIEDDGVGFDPASVSTGEHLGLFGMKERTDMIGGKLIVESAAGKGTTIMVEVSYDDTNHDSG